MASLPELLELALTRSQHVLGTAELLAEALGFHGHGLCLSVRLRLIVKHPSSTISSYKDIFAKIEESGFGVSQN